MRQVNGKLVSYYQEKESLPLCNKYHEYQYLLLKNSIFGNLVFRIDLLGFLLHGS